VNPAIRVGVFKTSKETTEQLKFMYPNCGKHPGQELNPLLYSTRREFLNRVGTGFGSLALASLMADQVQGQSAGGSLLAPKQPHYPGTAKRVCHIYFSGAQSHIDTWDPKPEMAKAEGKSTSGGGMRGGKILPSPFEFPKSGQSGLQISEIWTELSKCVDEMCIIRSSWTDVPAHEEATKIMTSGDFRLPKPSIGAWVTYGLGSDNQNLPAFVAMNPGGFPSAGAANWQSAFMPGAYQGTYVDPTNTRIEQIIENIKSQFIGTSAEQRQQLDLLSRLNEIHKQKRQAEGQLDARIQSFELAYRMQTDATEAFDMSKEPAHILKLYGADSADRGEATQGRQFIIARRLLERGVKFVQCWNGGWDMHAGIAAAGRARAASLDRPMAGFLQDLKQRGLLKDTLVAASTEFGRSSTEDGPGGRTHNAKAFASWLAGGGVKGGTSYGSTDELGSAAVENKVHVHEFHSTILHALGFDSEKLTFRSGGRDFRLTDVSGAQPVKSIFA
jgi:hypothetical protein